MSNYQSINVIQDESSIQYIMVDVMKYGTLSTDGSPD